jgi:hypothetical protein
MAILNQWGIPYGVMLLQSKRPQLMPVINILVEEDGGHTTITIYYHMVLEEAEDFSDD